MFLSVFLFALRVVDAAPPVDLPDGCWPRQAPCAVRFLESETIQTGPLAGSTVSAGTALVLEVQDRIQMLRGDLIVSGGQERTLKDGIVEVLFSGEILFSKHEGRLAIFNLNGNVRVKSSGIANEVLPAGFGNWYQGISAKGAFHQGLLAAWEPHQVLERLQKLGWTQEDLQKRLETYKRNRKIAVAEAANLYSSVVQQRAVDFEVAERRRKEALAKKEAETARIRKLFRDRFYNPDR